MNRIKPQTREHFDICRLLSVRRGIAVLTKSDLVDRETLDVVRLEVEEFLRNSFLDAAHSSVVAVSSLTGAGLDELRQALVKVAAEIPARDSSASGASAHRPRLHHERIRRGGDGNADFRHDPQRRRAGSFSGGPAGAGARSAGAWAGGRASGGRPAHRVESGRQSPRKRLARGMVLAPPSTFHTTSRLDVSLTLLPSAKPLKDRARVHLHAYTFETIATVVLLQTDKSRSRREKPRWPSCAWLSPPYCCPETASSCGSSRRS